MATESQASDKILNDFTLVGPALLGCFFSLALLSAFIPRPSSAFIIYSKITQKKINQANILLQSK